MGLIFLFMQCIFAVNVAFAYRYVCLVKTHWRERFLSRTVQAAIQGCIVALSISVVAGWYFTMWDNNFDVGADVFLLVKFMYFCNFSFFSIN
jgi:hypothetical protein